MRFLTFSVGAVLEAWSEFRTHRARVLMSLLGVAVAVFALTSVAAVSAVAQQSVTEGLERQSGRPALLTISTPYQPNASTSAAPPAGYAASVAREMRRYDVRWWSRTASAQAEVALPGGAQSLSVQAVDRDYATMHRLRLADGSWFGPHDAERMAPAVIIDAAFWQSLGSPDLRTHPTITLTQPSAVTAVIVGVTPGGYPGSPTAMMLFDADSRLAVGTSAEGADEMNSQYEAWVPPHDAERLTDRLTRDLSATVGLGWQVDVQRTDYAAQQGPDPLLLLKVVVAAAAVLILLLGALGLVNIALVTIQTRIREIGIRRSFGATAARVFVAIMLESVVATAAAGVAGVTIAILVLKNQWATDWLHRHGVVDVPAFPASAALTGFVVAVAVGALAGLLPAIVAVRVKPIEAIRF